MCLASDILVRTTEGDKRVGDVQTGDILYDAKDRQTPCIGVAPPATDKLKTITFQIFDSRKWTSFTCTPDYRLTATTSGTRPCISRKSVSWFTRCDRTSSYIPSSQPHPPDDAPRSSSPLSDSSSMELDKAAQDRVYRRFKSEELAHLALKTLQSDRHHLLDPLVVRAGEKFRMTVAEYEQLCCKVVKRFYLKLYRAPLSSDPSTATADPQALPLDPNYVALWLGDGDAATTRIASADPETAVWLQSYVDRLNSSRPPDNKLYLAEYLERPAGTVLSNGYVSKCDVFDYTIACLRLGPRKTNNPVLDGLRELGLLGNKSGGIPDAYMEADEDTLLKVIAGLIDSDGSYDKSHNRYKFTQRTEGHRKVVYDLLKLATSCGISVSDVQVGGKMRGFGVQGPYTPEYIIYLGKGSEKFQKHLLLPRKKMNLEHTYINHDGRPFAVTDAPAGECRAIQVRGGRFQLANRLVVCDSQLNNWFDSPAQGKTDTQTLSSQQVQCISGTPAPTASESPSSSSKAAPTTQPIQKPQSKSSSNRPPKASTSKSSQKSTPASTKKSPSPRKPLQPKPDSQLNARNSTSVTAMNETYFDPSENVLVVEERSTAAMVLLADEERGLIPSDDEDTPDSVMPDTSDEPNQPILPPKNSPSKPRSATPRSPATKRPRNGTKMTTPRSSSSGTSTPDVTITTAETTFIESEIQPERIEQVPPMPTTCPLPALPPEPAITWPPPIEMTDYVPRKRKIKCGR
ncbi:uncharacterized protein V1513DRAFT_465939 [Lipomyces chichibuensis]|uniref:uncharacterized protein n=1 Tax=Lipomyces chichibuensis TaxID=1546026 RepID=UPI003343408C